MEPAFLIAPLLGGLLAMLVRLPPLVGFLAAGFVLKFMGYESTSTLETIADLGVTIMLFTIGLKLNVRTLLQREVWGTSTLHMVGITVIYTGILAALKATGIALLAGAGWSVLLLIAFALSFSSTVFVVKVLDDRGETRSLYGRVAVGILIMQDIFAVIFLGASTGELPSPFAFGLLLLIPAAPFLQRILARVGHGEMQILLGVVMALTVGYALFHAVGIEGDLGALIVGMLLAPHPAADNLSKSLFNIKELFLVGFFVSIGLVAIPTVGALVLALILTALVPIQAVLFAVLLTLFRMRPRTTTLAALLLANYSEFGLIVLALAGDHGWLGDDWLVVLSLSLAFTLLLSAVINTHAESIYHRIHGRFPQRPPERLHPGDRPVELGDADVIVLGMGRVGAQAAERLATDYGCRVLGVDNDPRKVADLAGRGFRVVEGDAEDSDFWDKVVDAHTVDLVVLAMSHHAGNLAAFDEVHKHGFTGIVAAAALHADQVEALHRHGAHTVFHLYAVAGTSLADQAAEAAGLRKL